jgi:hypothetical protein
VIAVAKAARYGKCRKCPAAVALTSQGLVRFHKRLHPIHRTVRCDGVGQPPSLVYGEPTNDGRDAASRRPSEEVTP